MRRTPTAKQVRSDHQGPRVEPVVTESPSEIVDQLRQRIQRAVQAGALGPGSRLPSARKLASELAVDQRVLLAAYRELASEGVVEMRSRGGIYISERPEGAAPAVLENWLSDMFAHGVARDIPVPELHEWMRRSVETLRLRAVAFEVTEDQTMGLCRELRDDYGLEATAEHPAVLTNTDELPIEVRRADLLVTTPRHEKLVRAVANQLGKTCVVTAVRPDLISGEWRLLLGAPVYLIIADRGFEATLKRFFAGTTGEENLRILVACEDDLAGIPPDAPTYVTRGARAKLGDQRIPGRIIPAPRLLSAATSREITGFIVRANLRALRGAQ